MREIKYRAWDNINNIMVKIARIDIADGTCYTRIFDGRILDFWNDCILEQFTGLYDKNGVEIYEGDRIRVFGFTINPKTKEKIPYDVVAIVKYSEVTACFLYLVDNSCVWSNFRYSKSDGLDFEVIGNIHENNS